MILTPTIYTLFPYTRSSDLLLQMTMEGFFADPMYGGNRNMAAWKMVGYPGLPATYREEIKTYLGKKYDKPPRSIRSEEHTSELQSLRHLVCRLLLENKKRRE